MNHKFFLTLALGVFLVGCEEPTTGPVSSPQDNEHSEHASFEDTVGQLVTVRNQIRDAFAAGNPDGADDPIHDAPSLVEALEHAAEDEGVEGDDLNAVRDAVVDLNEALDAIHEGMHDEDAEGASFDDVAEKFNGAIDTLVKLSGANADGIELEGHGDHDEHGHEGHDHEGHDHEGHDHEEHGDDHEGHDHDDHEGHDHDEKHEEGGDK